MTRRTSPRLPGAVERAKGERLETALALAGIVLVPLARGLRPLPESAGPALRTLVGVLPNLGAGVALPCVFRLLARTRRRARRARRSGELSPLLASGATVAGLAGWEFLQEAVWGYPIDVFDLVASVAGAGIAFVALTMADRRGPGALGASRQASR